MPRGLEGLKPILILPLLGAGITGLLMIYVVGTPVKIANDALTAWLSGMQQSSALVLGLILGAMMAFDMGGPVNKAAYAFAVGLIDSEVYLPMAAVMAAGMTPPLGLALASALFKNRFTNDEQEAGKAAWVLGCIVHYGRGDSLCGKRSNPGDPRDNGWVCNHGRAVDGVWL
jgi:PTS system fructose-specific IIC component